MSSSLALIVLGQAYFLGSSPNVPYTVPLTSKKSTNYHLPSPAALTAIGSNHPVVREDYTYTPGIGAHKVHSDALRWHEARTVCKSEGGDLAVINSKAENDLLVELLASAEPSTNTDSIHMALIGFHDLNEEGKYETVDGKSLSEAGYDTWAPGEPNNGQGLGDDCGSMYRKGTLNDANCRQRFAYICELPHSDLGPPATPTKPVSVTKLPEQVIESVVTTDSGFGVTETEPEISERVTQSDVTTDSKFGKEETSEPVIPEEVTESAETMSYLGLRTGLDTTVQILAETNNKTEIPTTIPPSSWSEEAKDLYGDWISDEDNEVY